MKVKLTTGHEYDLSVIDGDRILRNLKQRICELNLEFDKRASSLSFIYEQVKPYAGYNRGDDLGLQRAAKVYQFLVCKMSELQKSPVRLVVAPTSPPEVGSASVAAPSTPPRPSAQRSLSFDIPAGTPPRLAVVEGDDSAAIASEDIDVAGTAGSVEEYLGLPVIDSHKPIISHAPLNSSGDIYHIIAYLILAQTLGKTLPEVLLSYDTEGTKKQVSRSHNFAKTLGFGRLFKIIALPKTRCYRENSRQFSLESYLREHRSDDVYVDQMATTTITASLFLQHDWEKIVGWLRAGFSRRDETYFPRAVQEKVDSKAETEIVSVKAKLQTSDQPILIMHLRYSMLANKKLNIPDDFTSGLINYFRSKGYFTWCMLADDRVRGLPTYPADYRTAPFSEPITDPASHVDYGKQTHLSLLLKLTQLPNIKGIIGNTSGTLDLAAFVGHHVYNIHQFGEAIAYQDYRLAMQFTFLSAEDFNAEAFKRVRMPRVQTPVDLREASEELTSIVSRALPNMDKWAITSKLVQPSIYFPGSRIARDKAGFRKMFYGTFFVASGVRRLPLPDTERVHELTEARLTTTRP